VNRQELHQQSRGIRGRRLEIREIYIEGVAETGMHFGTPTLGDFEWFVAPRIGGRGQNHTGFTNATLKSRGLQINAFINPKSVSDP